MMNTNIKHNLYHISNTKTINQIPPKLHQQIICDYTQSAIQIITHLLKN